MLNFIKKIFFKGNQKIITLKVLEEKGAESDFLTYFKTLEKREWEVMELVERIHQDKKNFSAWLFVKFELSGFSKGFYESGEVSCECNYKDDKLHGVDKGFYESGLVRLERHYENDVLISEKKS